jgi:hypothetical protein
MPPDDSKLCPMCGATIKFVARKCRFCGEMFETSSATGALFSPKQIATAAFLGAPIAACWFLSRNYRALDQGRSAVQSLLWGVLGTAALLGISFFLPDNFPNQALPLGYTFGLYQFAKRMQGETVAEHVATGGRLGSWWKVVGVSLVFLVLIVIAIFGVVFVFDPGD